MSHILFTAFKKLYVALKGDFIVPVDYPGHEHQWVMLDAGMCICKLCGADHICFQGHCPVVQMEHSESVCSITGCVIALSELKAEWGALDRVHNPSNKSTPRHGGGGSMRAIKHFHSKKNGLLTKPPHHHPYHCQLICSHQRDIHDTVETVVREILDSSKTTKCIAEEISRDQTRKAACLAKIIRDLANEHIISMVRTRPNMLELEAKLSWQCRKCRVPPSLPTLTTSTAFKHRHVSIHFYVSYYYRFLIILTTGGYSTSGADMC